LNKHEEFTFPLPLPYTYILSISSFNTHPIILRCHGAEALLRSRLYPKNPFKSEALGDISQQACFFLRRGVVSPTPSPQAGGPTLVGCPRLFIQYIRSYLDAVFSIRNTMTRHAVVTWNRRCGPDNHSVAE
jgi:hypothetical protein